MSKQAELNQLLLKCIEKHDLSLKDIVINIETANFSTIERLQDIVSDELIENGFDIDDKPTKYGLQLEELIDYLGNFYSNDN